MVTKGGASGTVLIVDDNAELVRGLTTMLANAGYRAHALYAGSGVVEACALHRPDVVVLDVMMPGLDGWEVLRRIRENPVNERLPVMMLTAKDSEDAKVHGFSLGADDYLTKPFGLREFRARVDALVRRAAAPSAEDPARLPVVAEGGTDYLRVADVCYIEGVRNYTRLYTYDTSFLGRLPLGETDKLGLPDLMRVHRSYIVRMGAVRGHRRLSKSAFRLVMDDAHGTLVPVSRTLVAQVRQRLGVMR